MAATDQPTPATVASTTAPSTTASSTDLSAGAIGGRTVVADSVVSKVAGIAAREVPGVFALGGGAARAFGAVRDVIGSTDLGQGVRVQVGETEVAADVTIVVDYPVAMTQVADQVRTAVAGAVEQLVGLQVSEVNVSIVDVHIPGDDDED